MNYEEYMRSVLGYSTCGCGNIYNNTYDYGYDLNQDFNFNPSVPTNQISRQNTNFNLTDFYPETYKMLNPMVCKVCEKNLNKEMTSNLLEEMTNEIYNNFESNDRLEQNQKQILKNGDVRNPNVKEPENISETRHRNYLLRDLIKILILNNWKTNLQMPVEMSIHYNNGNPYYLNNQMFQHQMQARPIYNTRNYQNSNFRPRYF